MAVHLRVRHWVVVWFWLAVIFGAVALVNVVVRDLPRTEDKVVAVVSAFFWLIGGVFCYAVDGITIENKRTGEVPDHPASPFTVNTEWHSASDFLYPGNRKSLLPPRH